MGHHDDAAAAATLASLAIVQLQQLNETIVEDVVCVLCAYIAVLVCVFCTYIVSESEKWIQMKLPECCEQTRCWIKGCFSQRSVVGRRIWTNHVHSSAPFDRQCSSCSTQNTYRQRRNIHSRQPITIVENENWHVKCAKFICGPEDNLNQPMGDC